MHYLHWRNIHQTGVLEYHAVLVYMKQIRSSKDVSHRPMPDP